MNSPSSSNLPVRRHPDVPEPFIYTFSTSEIYFSFYMNIIEIRYHFTIFLIELIIIYQLG